MIIKTLNGSDLVSNSKPRICMALLVDIASWMPHNKHMTRLKLLYCRELVLEATTMLLRPIISAFKRQVFLVPIESITNPLPRLPRHSPKPKNIMPCRVFEVRPISVSFSSVSRDELSYNLMISGSIPCQNAKETPDHTRYKTRLSIFLSVNNLRTFETPSFKD